VRDLDARGLRARMPGLAPFVCVCRSTRRSRSSPSITRAASRSTTPDTSRERGRGLLEALGPAIADVGHRIEVDVEALPVVATHRLPHHLAHHVVAQVCDR